MRLIVNRYLIYLPQDDDWKRVVLELQSVGIAKTDHKNLVTLVSDAPLLEIQKNLARIVRHYIIGALQGDVGYAVSGETISAISVILS
jgi:hypothetical protein